MGAPTAGKASLLERVLTGTDGSYVVAGDQAPDGDAERIRATGCPGVQIHFDVARFRERALRIQPELRLFEVSATRGDGLDELQAWIDEQRMDRGPTGGVPC